MPRQRRILKHHILDAALELMKQEDFDRFTARKIAECLNASTQPIYKEFKNMDDLKCHLTEYIKIYLNKEIFQTENTHMRLRDVCANYIYFARNQGTLFSVLFMDREIPALSLHDFVYSCMETVASRHEALANKEDRDVHSLLDVMWPVVHGFAILTAQGKYQMNDEELIKKIDSIVTHSYKVWESKQQA